MSNIQYIVIRDEPYALTFAVAIEIPINIWLLHYHKNDITNSDILTFWTKKV